jgi:hypothetical protein
MRHAIAAALLLLPTSAMAGTYVYTPVHVAPVVHVAPMVHVNPGVHPIVRTAPTGGRVVTHHSHQKILPVTVVATTPNPKKCADPKLSKDCQKK